MSKGGLSPADHECALSIVTRLLKHPASVDFLAPVDYVELGLLDYPNVITQPMDLGTVELKLKAGMYRSLHSLANDLNLIWDNCKMYNEATSIIVKRAEKLEKLTRKWHAKLGGEEVTFEEKVELAEKIRRLDSRMMDKMVEFVRAVRPKAVRDFGDGRELVSLEGIDRDLYRNLCEILRTPILYLICTEGGPSISKVSVIMIFVLRHGERCDLSAMENERARITVTSDPPLTQKGFLMAQRTGAKIKAMIPEGDAYLRIVASPFARCLETAQGIAESFPGVDRIWVDYQTCEFLNVNWYQCDPQEELLITTSPDFQASMRVPTEPLSSSRPHFPETWSEFTTRFITWAHATIANWVMNGENVIVVTHGYNVDLFTSNLGYDELQTAEFCALTAAKRKGDWVELVVGKTSEHVADLLNREE